MISIVTHNQIIGCHNWPDAPAKYGYLRALHRHVFVIRCKFEVSHTNRHIEINDMQEKIDKVFHDEFGYSEEGWGLQFGPMSCEDMARWCIDKFNCVECEVLEDGFGGAYVRK